MECGRKTEYISITRVTVKVDPGACFITLSFKGVRLIVNSN